VTATLTPTKERPPGLAPQPGRKPAVRRRLRPKEFRATDVGLLAATGVSAFSVVWIVFDQLTLLSGTVGFVICWIVAFLALYWAVNLQVYGRQMAADRFVGALVAIGALCMFTPLALITGFVLVKGIGLISWHLLTATQKGVPQIPTPGAPTPGVGHAIVGTVEIVALAAAMGIPAALLTAIFLNEVGGRFTKSVRVVVTAMSGVPAIVAGIFIYSLWIVQLGQGFSGFAGALALTVILLPTITRGSEEVLRVVPNDLREASAALGAPEWRTTSSVVLPTARSGIITAILLGIAVAVGETAPLLVTIFGNTLMNANPFHGPQEALSLLAYQEIRLPQQAAINLAYAASLVLFMLVFILFVIGRILGSDWAGRALRRGRGSKKKGGDEDFTPAQTRELSNAAALGLMLPPER